MKTLIIVMALTIMSLSASAQTFVVSTDIAFAIKIDSSNIDFVKDSTTQILAAKLIASQVKDNILHNCFSRAFTVGNELSYVYIIDDVGEKLNLVDSKFRLSLQLFVSSIRQMTEHPYKDVMGPQIDKATKEFLENIK